ncbi:hypothetical protein [Chelativorans xinjiangense]|uniref:hypothetical protein n=1 Tax=Chelativorans xinjiangense TaxID=2681485 RepID=UPI001357F6C5|nr:hypothetical protein [Chelativorans xinjiangense]
MGASALAGIAHWADHSRVAMITLTFTLGAALAFPAALYPACQVARRFETSRRFACFFLALSVMTVGLTALVFAFQYVVSVTAWHEGVGLHDLADWLLFTTATALYEFAVLGLRLYFPYGLFALFAFGLWFAARLR